MLCDGEKVLFGNFVVKQSLPDDKSLAEGS